MTSEQAKERSDKVKAAALPLIKLLSEQFHPHHTIIVTCSGYELLEGVCADNTIDDFIID